MKNYRENINNLWMWVYRSHVLNGKNKEKGNTLIIAISLGLIVLLATSVSLINSSKEKTNVQAGEFTKQAIAVAELGITRVHNFLAKNSKVAEFPLDQWASQAGTMQLQGTFTNSSTTTNSTCSTLTSSGGGGTTTATLVDTFKTSGDTVVNNATTTADFQKGGFKVTNYTLADANFNPVTSVDANSVSVGQTYGHGILTVQGKINPNATSLTNLFTSNPRTSQTKVEVAIPLKKAITNVSLPGVWISDQQIASPTNSVINATLLVPDCDNMGLNIMPGNSVIISTMTFPPLPTPPSVIDDGTNNTKYYNLGNVTNNIVLPRSTDLPIETKTAVKNGVTYEEKIYKYKVDSINLNGSEKLKVVPGRTVVLHLYGNIDIGGSQIIDNSCTSLSGAYTCDTSTKIVTYPSGNPSLFRRENLQILGYGTNPTPSNTSNPEPHVCLSGGSEVFGFVFVPDYAIGAAGTGAGNGFTGAVWARMFNPPSTCGSNTGQVVVVQDITDMDYLLQQYVPQNIPPQIGTIARWERKGS